MAPGRPSASMLFKTLSFLSFLVQGWWNGAVFLFIALPFVKTI